MINWQNAEFELSCGSVNQFFESTLPEIVFSGKSNVGKSSLINKLLNRKALARTSSEPGKTRTVNFFNIDNTIRFDDLPGYGYAKVSQDIKKKWTDLMDGFWADNRDIRLVIQLIDLRNGPTSDDMMMLDFLHYYNYNFIVAATKADKLKKTERANKLEELRSIKQLNSIEIIDFSVKEDVGRDRIRKIISKVVC